MADNFDFDSSFSFDLEEEKTDLEKQPKKRVEVQHRYGNRQLTRKASSEQALMKAMDWHFQEGDCYHCFSWGDVDSMSYLNTFYTNSGSITSPYRPGAWQEKTSTTFGNGISEGCSAVSIFSWAKSFREATRRFTPPFWISYKRRTAAS